MFFEFKFKIKKIYMLTQKETKKIIGQVRTLLDQGMIDAAFKSIDQAIQLSGDIEDILDFAALVAYKSNKFDFQERYLLKLIRINPSNYIYRINLISLYIIKHKRYEDALKSLEALSQIEFNDFNTLKRSGIIAAILSKPILAIKFYKKASLINPLDFELKYFLALNYLAQGELKEGWKLLDNRIDSHVQKSTRNIDGVIEQNIPSWMGEDLRDKSIIIISEQGFGDFIMFFRFVIELKSLYPTSHIKIVCRRPLIKLIESSPIDVDIYDEDDKNNLGKISADFYSFIMSIPKYLEISAEQLKNKIPFINRNKNLKTIARYRNQKKLSVGINWKGNLSFQNDESRSIHDVSLLAPLLELKNCNFVGLHHDGNNYIKGYEIDQIDTEITNFQDTADVISNLDLIISVDSANVHLAGSMDIPCWVLLPKVKMDWRWHLGEEVSYWYNSVRMFKQKEYDDWRHPIKCVKSELEKQLSQSDFTFYS